LPISPVRPEDQRIQKALQGERSRLCRGGRGDRGGRAPASGLARNEPSSQEPAGDRGARRGSHWSRPLTRRRVVRDTTGVATDEGVLDLGGDERAVPVRSPEGVAPDLALSPGPQAVQVERRQVDPLGLPRLDDERVAGALLILEGDR